jgi:hypothetical protein
MTAQQQTDAYQFFAIAFGAAPGTVYLDQLAEAYDFGFTTKEIVNIYTTKDAFTARYPNFLTSSDFATNLVNNVVGSSASAAAKAEAVADITAALNSGLTRGDVIFNVFSNLAALPVTDATWGGTAQLLANQVDVARFVTQDLLVNSTNTAVLRDYLNGVTQDPATVQTAITAAQGLVGVTFTLTPGTAAGADVMRLTGDQTVRIDFTNPANQITGLDLNGNGVIASNGAENAITGKAAGFAIVDAYARNPLNEGDIVNNFLGDIRYDGTGFDGDGVNTDGNIFLGGLGADIALGGIGNDFLAGGGVAAANTGSDRLDGGRNADFFFAELSLLSNTDGNNLTINGGSTSDDAAVGNNTPQDADWLLLQVSDDEDGTVVNLADGADGDALDENDQSVVTGSGRTINMTEIENVDASGNLYGFLNGVDVALGGAGAPVTNDEGTNQNIGIGSSAQLLIIGSLANNILIGGFDNDRIEGRDGSDLLFGGNLNYNNNTNLAGIVNNGMDELIGGAGADNIVFEADGGIIEGGDTVDVNDGENDTLWLTRESLGSQTAATMTTDDVLRFDLGSGKVGGIDNFAGYGGAGSTATPLSNASGTSTDFTADQTNYTSAASRVQVQDMENVIATGLGDVDYLAAGTNDPELAFNNQQNHRAYNGDLDLRGTAGENILYASTGNDVIEGRSGDDLLSGGEGNDDFLFQLGGAAADGIDIIHRQQDTVNNTTGAAGPDNLWDTDADGVRLFTQDFGVNSSSEFGPSSLSVDFAAANLVNANVNMSSFSVNIGGVTFAVDNLAALAAVTTVAGLATLANTAFQAIDANVTVSASGTVITITDSTPAGGRDISDTQAEGYAVRIEVNAPGTGTLGLPTFVAAGEDVSQDRLLFVAYDDRADNERVDDDAFFGGDSLGNNNYAQDLVVGFDVDGSTVIAERQSFRIKLENLAVQDIVTVDVNGVQYSLQVGRQLDGTLLPGETTSAFAGRLASLINNFLDDDTAAGKVDASSSGSGNSASITLTQAEYANEETVFMRVSVEVDDNSSNGEGAFAEVVNTSSTDITLFQFDARNNALNATNVLFVGDTGTSRSVLETAKDAGGMLLGSDAIVVNVTPDDNITSATAGEGVGTTAIFFNAVENPTTGQTNNFAIHGDDQLFGGNGVDTIDAGTGDDRVYGSLGADRIDGGKDLYLVDGVIRVLNDREAIVLDALPATLSIEAIQDGTFEDTLIYQQSDFGTVGAGGSAFNIALDLSALQANGGAGRVIVNGAAANTTLFTNMENIRTVSGDGTLAGQGNDTLDLSVSINPVTGLATASSANTRYFLTKEADDGGEVRLFTTNAATGDATGAGTLFTKVDGVENVIGGSGTDYLYIDQTESGKNNSFNAGTSTVSAVAALSAAQNAAQTLANGDAIFYENNFFALTPAQLPAVTLAIGAANVDTVTMTGGQLPAGDAPVDTLTGVEFINIGAVARNVDEADELDVSALTAGATVNFTTSEINNGATLVATVIGMSQFEIVTGSIGNDTVIVADTMTNASSDAADLSEDATGNILFDSFLTYDVLDETIGAALDADTVPERMTVAELRAVTGASETAAQAAIDDVINQGQFTFSLGDGIDRVDYSAETGGIAAVIDIGNTTTNVIVDQAGTFASLRQAGDRIDVLTNVEQIVAARGPSVLDFTAVDQDVQITFQYQVANATVLAAGNTIESIVRIADGSGNVISGLSAFVERYTVGGTNVTWNTIEGSDANESVRYEGSENLITQVGVDHRYSDDTLNLRGGDNGVSYTAIETSITVDITVNEDTGSGDGTIEAIVDFQDGNSNTLTDAGQHTITSYGGDNAIAAGTLKIEASQDAEDTVSFNTESDKVFLLGISAGVLNVNIGTVNSMVLTGFEILLDAASDDVYDMADLETVQLGMDLVDNATDDTDTIKVVNDAVDYDGGPFQLDTNLGGANTGTISLETLNDVFNFDFDVLDITGVTEGNLIIVGDDDDQDNDGTTNDVDADYVFGPDGLIFATGADGVRDTDDDVIIGSVDLLDSVNGFANIWLTNASIASAGSVYELDIDASELISNNVTNLDTDTTGLNFSLVTTAVTVTVTDDGAVGATVVGTAMADTITGGAGDDVIEGGGGADLLDGGVNAADAMVRTYEFTGGLIAGANNASLTIGGLVLTEGTAITDGAGQTQIATDVVAALTADIAGADASGLGADGVVSVTSSGGLITFTYAPGLNATTIGAVFALNGDLGTMLLSGEQLVTAGTDQTDSADTFVYAAATDGGDTIINFVSGVDTIGFKQIPSSTSNLLGDQIDDSDGGAIGFASASDGNAAASQVFNDEAAFIDAANNGTFAAANLTNLTAVAALFNANFTFTGGAVNTYDALFVLESDTVGTFGFYFYDAADTDNVVEASELTLMGVVTGDAVATSDFLLV